MLSKSEVKYIQSLQQKKFRDLHRTFVAEGPKVVEDLVLQQSFDVKKIYAIEEWFMKNAPLLQITNEQVVIVKDYELEKISLLKTPNQVLAIFSQRAEHSFVPETEAITLMLEDIRDPGNFGTIIRTADWFGISDILCSQNCVDLYNPKVVQSTMASLGRVHVHYTDLEAICETFPDIKLYSAVLGGHSLARIKPQRPAFLLIGNEGAGISERMLAKTGERVFIPGDGGAESLNAAVATGILLYAFTR